VVWIQKKASWGVPIKSIEERQGTATILKLKTHKQKRSRKGEKGESAIKKRQGNSYGSRKEEQSKEGISDWRKMMDRACSS